MTDQEGRGPRRGRESDGEGQVGDQVSRGVLAWGSEAEEGWVSVSATAGLGGCGGDAHHRGWGREGGSLSWGGHDGGAPCLLILTGLLGKFY